MRAIGKTTLKATRCLAEQPTEIEPLPSCEGVLSTMSLFGQAGREGYTNYSVLRG